MSDNRTFLEIIAPDVEDAIARALFELGVDEEDVDVEILDEGNIDEGRQARVRVTVRPAEPEALDDESAVARKTLQDLLAKMRVRARVVARRSDHSAPPDEDNPVVLDVQGDDLGALIGHRGETLASLQYLVRLMVSKQLNAMANVVVDVEGYKRRREEQLQRLALRIADQATQQGKIVSLEPMPANERRIIHLALRERTDVTTESIGEGRSRKVTVIPKIAKS